MSKRKPKGDDGGSGQQVPQACDACIRGQVALLAMAQAVVNAGATLPVVALLRRHLLTLPPDNGDYESVTAAMDKLAICYLRAKPPGD